MSFQPRKLALASAIALAALWTSSAAIADCGSDKPMSQEVIDARQEAQIWTSYALSPYLRAHDISVSVHHGKATLTGRVEEDVNRDLAKEIALGVEGVKEVDNKITVDAAYVSVDSAASSEFADRIDDATISAAVRSKFAWSKYPDGQEIAVKTTHGKVMLTGTANTSEASDQAGRMAMNTRGVASVDNRIQVSAPKPGAAANTGNSMAQNNRDIADSWITTKVKSTFMYSSNVDSADITVSTASGIVTLGGKVNSGAEKALAIELARNVRGVKSVDSAALTL